LLIPREISGLALLSVFETSSAAWADLYDDVFMKAREQTDDA